MLSADDAARMCGERARKREADAVARRAALDLKLAEAIAAATKPEAIDAVLASIQEMIEKRVGEPPDRDATREPIYSVLFRINLQPGIREQIDIVEQKMIEAGYRVVREFHPERPDGDHWTLKISWGQL